MTGDVHIHMSGSGKKPGKKPVKGTGTKTGGSTVGTTKSAFGDIFHPKKRK